MHLPLFKLEEFWKKYEFTSPYLLCCSDAESWKLNEILALADAESRRLWESLSLGYTESPGMLLLRTEIARLYSSIESNQVLTCAGAEEGIYCSMRALIQPGDHVITIDPCYQSLATLPPAFDAEVTRISLKAEKKWRLELEDVKKAFRSNTKLLILNYPHNPTGTLLSKDVWEGIVDIARRCGAYIFCDEVYRYMEIEESQRLPSIADIYEKGIALNVMTKAFGLAGLRIGWLATKDKAFLNKAGSYKLYTSICNSAPSEILALIALRSKEIVLKRNRTIMLKNFRLLQALMDRQSSLLSWVMPQSGTIAAIKLLLPVSVEKFAQELVDDRGVLIMPGSVFDLPGNIFRIGFGKKNMAEILGRFEEFLEDQGRQYA